MAVCAWRGALMFMYIYLPVHQRQGRFLNPKEWHSTIHTSKMSTKYSPQNRDKMNEEDEQKTRIVPGKLEQLDHMQASNVA